MYAHNSVHGHWHSVSTHTVPTKCQYGHHSSLIFQEHYHSQRHSKSSIFVEILEKFWRIFWIFLWFLQKIQSSLKYYYQKLVNHWNSCTFFITFLGGSMGAGALKNTQKVMTQCGYGWAPKNSGCPCTLAHKLIDHVWANMCFKGISSIILGFP